MSMLLRGPHRRVAVGFLLVALVAPSLPALGAVLDQKAPMVATAGARAERSRAPVAVGTTMPPPPIPVGTTVPPPPITVGTTVPPPPTTVGTTVPPPPTTVGATVPPPPTTVGTTVPPPPTTVGTTVPPPPSGAAALAAEVVRLTNIERAAVGRSALSAHPLVTAAAVAHSQDQAARQFMGHIGSDGSDAGTRLTRAGFTWRALGENVAVGQPTAAAVVTAWMNSAGHRANMLNSAFTTIGVGVVTGADGRNYWTMVLAA